MKLLRLLLICTSLVLSFFFVSAQDNKTSSTNFSNPFGDKKNSFTFMQNKYYSNTKTFVNDVEYSKYNSLGVDLEWNRWFKGGLGAGLGVSYQSSGQHYGNNDQLYRNWSASPSVSYGTTLLPDKLYTYFRVGATFGVDKYIDKNPPASNTDKTNLAGFNTTAAFPWRVLPNTFLTPKLVFRNLAGKYENGKDKDNSFGIQFNLEDYLLCDEMKCDHKHKFSLSKDAYDQGSSFIDYTSSASILFGNKKSTNNSSPGTIENSYNNIFLNGAYSYYVIDYLAIGAHIHAGTMIEKTKDIDFKYTWNTFSIEPNITANVPVDNGWRNLFVMGAYNFGSDKYKVQSGSYNNTDKNKDRGYTVGVGLNTFFEKHTAFTGYAGYRSTTIEDKSNGDKSKTRGLYLSGGLRLSF